MSIASRTSLSLIIRAGTNLITFPPAPTRRSPFSIASATTGPAGIESSMPCIRPMPLTSEIMLYLSLNSRSFFVRRAPCFLTFSRTPPLKSSSITTVPADVARLFPPNVDAWSPGLKASAALSFAIIAPIGTPPARPFANAAASGSTPNV